MIEKHISKKFTIACLSIGITEIPISVIVGALSLFLEVHFQLSLQRNLQMENDFISYVQILLGVRVSQK